MNGSRLPLCKGAAESTACDGPGPERFAEGRGILHQPGRCTERISGRPSATQAIFLGGHAEGAMAADNPNNQEAGRTMFLADTNLTMMNSANTPYPTRSMVLAMAVAMVLRSIISTAQAQNLVPNPGFEEADSCSDQLPPFVGIHDWYSINGSPDHLRSCLPYGDFRGLPMNFFTYQEPFEGASCAGMYTYFQSGSIEGREWIMAPLLQPLEVGQTYYCSFRANAAFGGNHTYPQHWLANDKVGMRFTTTAVPPWSVGDPFPVPPNHAHIMYPQILSDTVGWTLVSGSFVADSAYQYVMIGQFFSNALTDTLQFSPEGIPWYWLPRAYTLVDAVCVSPSLEGCDLGQGVGEEQAIGPVLFPNPALDQMVVGQRSGAEALVLDAVGRVLWQGRIPNDRWVLEVGSWARSTYVLRIAHRGRLESHKFVLTE
ncbi:MAG: hypothetical protein IPM49_05120 [Flavobacteriales bacterium]|nr:hypothetical protein [Flavobacteriales bacterium]